MAVIHKKITLNFGFKDIKFEKYLTKKISVKQKSLRVTKNWDL